MRQFDDLNSLHRCTEDWCISGGHIADYLREVAQSQRGREFDRYHISLDIWPQALWQIPARFRDLF